MHESGISLQFANMLHAQSLCDCRNRAVFESCSTNAVPGGACVLSNFSPIIPLIK